MNIFVISPTINHDVEKSLEKGISNKKRPLGTKQKKTLLKRKLTQTNALEICTAKPSR